MTAYQPAPSEHAEALRTLDKLQAEIDEIHAKKIAELTAKLESLREAERKPRSWSMPVIPEDVTVVRDSQGFQWRRVGQSNIWRRRTGAWTDDIIRIMQRLGPLVEVVESSTEEQK